MKICTQILASVFIFDKNWKQLRCPSIGELINKFCTSDNGVLFKTEQQQQQKSCQAMTKKDMEEVGMNIIE